MPLASVEVDNMLQLSWAATDMHAITHLWEMRDWLMRVNEEKSPTVGQVSWSGQVMHRLERRSGKRTQLWEGFSRSSDEASDWLCFFHLSVLQCSTDLTCFIRFNSFDVYTTKNYRHKYKAPTDFCFILKVTLRSTADLWPQIIIDIIILILIEA